MKLVVLSVGAVKKPYISQGIDEYVKRIKRYVPFELIDVKDETASTKMPRVDVLKKERARIESKLKDGDYLIALVDSGKGFSSKDFSDTMERILSGSGITARRVVFIVGGAYGLDKEIIERADMVLSLSKLTLPHELARLVLSEQIYRAFTIMRGEPYSH